MNTSSPSISSWQFAIFRILFGGYLMLHFVALLPYGSELFGNQGLMADPALNPAAGLFPNPLNLALPPFAISAVLIVLLLASLCLAAGFFRPVVCLILWFGWSALFHRNNLIGNPSIPYISLLLILCALVPTGEPLAWKPRNDWKMPVWIPRCAVFLLAAGYTFSGYTKLFSVSWTDGSAMTFLLENPLARSGVMRDIMLSLPDGTMAFLTWFALAAELLYLPLSLARRTRPWIWLVMVLMHLGIIAAVDFADLSFGMLMIHAFTFDKRWIPGKFSKVIVAYDGECLMCNRWIRFIAAEDHRDVIRFTTLQGEVGKTMEKASGIKRLSGLVVEADGKFHSRAAAIIVLLSTLGGMWRAAAWISAPVPICIGNVVYDFVAKRRHMWWGKLKTCSLPDQNFRSKIL